MSRLPRWRSAPLPAEPQPGDDAQPTDVPSPTGTGAPLAVLPDLGALPIAGITRRHVAGVLGALLAAWVIILFVRQVGDAAAATTRAERIAAENAAILDEVDALERELELIGRDRFVNQQARGYGLGGDREIAFTLDPEAPALPDDAPGSAALRVGATAERTAPLEVWLTVLFGPLD
jgi:cell division protein FtsB